MFTILLLIYAIFAAAIFIVYCAALNDQLSWKQNLLMALLFPYTIPLALFSIVKTSEVNRTDVALVFMSATIMYASLIALILYCLN